MSVSALMNSVAADARAVARRSSGAQRPRVVMLSTWHPEPADNGRKQRTRGMIEALAGAYDVVLISLLSEADPPEPLLGVPHVARQFCVRLPGSSRSPLRLAANALHGYPRSQLMIWSAATAEQISAIVSDVDAQVVVGTDLRTVRYLMHVSATAVTILDEPDVSPFVVQSRPAASGLRGARARARAWKLRRLLRDASSGLDGVVVASEPEAAAYQGFVAYPAPQVIENGIAALPRTPWTPSATASLLYTGSITYQPNHEAVAFMQREVLPRLQVAGVEPRLVVTGRLPSPIPADCRSPHIQFTGVLPDLEEQLRAARVFVCPLRSGTGTRIKLIEAMSYGLPIVSTRKGAEGLAVEDGVHLLLADEADDFAHAVQLLHSDEVLARRLGANARELVRRCYTWETQGVRLRALVEQLIQAGAAEVTHG